MHQHFRQLQEWISCWACWLSSSDIAWACPRSTSSSRGWARWVQLLCVTNLQGTASASCTVVLQLPQSCCVMMPLTAKMLKKAKSQCIACCTCQVMTATAAAAEQGPPAVFAHSHAQAHMFPHWVPASYLQQQRMAGTCLMPATCILLRSAALGLSTSITQLPLESRDAHKCIQCKQHTSWRCSGTPACQL